MSAAEATSSAPGYSQLGLKPDEYEEICRVLGREPSTTELAMYSVMWSEHCSYKSSKVHLATLPTKGPRVLMGPGENAGIVDVGDGLAVTFRIESHNHPSFVEPFQGAATGVGGIVRDILAVGARPVAIMDSLRFGDPTDALTRHLVRGVVHGIGQYGNSIGVPTVGGELRFDPCYAGNPLINALCVGVLPADRILHGRADRVGDVAILLGAKTGRDGIGGVSVLASATFDEESQAKRPSVQVADPFREKLLIEACLELAEKRLLQGLQDLGGAGFTCATCETASRGHRGMRVWMDRVPLRESSMEPFEVAMSESQERMLAIVAPSNAEEVEAICAKWGVPATRIGEVTEGSILEVHWKGEIVASIPARSLADEGPVYERPMERPEWLDRVQATDLSRLPVPEDLGEALVKILSDPNQADAAWVYEQYDFLVQHNTLEGPTGDAAVLRLPNSSRGIAISTDGNGHYSYLDPYTGAALSTAEAARNVACTGAQPVAVTNCLNFGNPENPNVMWQFAEVIRGMGDACRSLGTPVTGGNVSFYNETSGEAIHPTPVVGVLGLLEDVERRCGNAFRASGDAVWLLGPTMVEFGGSEYSRVIHGVLGGLPPSIDLDLEARLHKLLVESISAGLLSSAHDLSEGGLGVALAESAIAGGIGADLHLPQRKAPHVWLFSESASRVLVSVCPEAEDDLRAMADRWEVPALRLGQVGGDRVNIDGVLDLSVTELGEARRSPLPRLMSEGL